MRTEGAGKANDFLTADGPGTACDAVAAEHGERPDSPFDSVGIIGLGVMGGSLARALRRLARPPAVLAWSPAAGEMESALQAGVVERVPGSIEEVLDARLVVYATPLDACIRLIPVHAPLLAADALATDVGSLMAPVLDIARAVGLSGRWIGSHPMCGSERSGFGASRADLYDGVHVWMSSEPQAEARMADVERFWRAVGARPARVAAEAHDERMTLVSHLPQLTATALAQVLAEHGVDVDELGPGGRGMTRLAASSPLVWRDILAHAPDRLQDVLRALSRTIGDIADGMESGDLDALETLMLRTRTWRGGG